MKKIEKVEVENNTLLFQYGNLEARITPVLNDGKIAYRLVVFDKTYNKDFCLYFYTLEDTVNFVENVVAKSINIGEVINTYKELLKSYDDKHKKLMNEVEVIGAISNHFCADKAYKVAVGRELSIEKDAPKIMFFLLEEFDIGGKKIINKVYLTEGDLINALNSHFKKQNCEVEGFKYMGGIHRAGYYFDKDTPYFEGLEVYTKELNKEEDYSLSRRQIVSN